MSWDYDRKADRTAAARTKVQNTGEESSDQKAVVGMSGNEETDNDNFNFITNIPNN